MKRSSLRSAGSVAALTTTAMMLVAGCGVVANRPALTTEFVRGWGAVAFSSPSEAREAVVHYGDRDKLTKLVNAGADVWSVDRKAVRAKMKVTGEQAKLAQSLGMQVEWPTRQTTFRADSGYRNYDQITARLKELAAKHPEFATLVDIGDSWETTQGKAKREIWALKLTTGGKKPNVTVAGCHHAREIVTPELVLKMAEHLVDGYGTDAEATALVESRELWLIPLVNPDAHTRAVTGTDWRKNGNNVTGGKRRVGVDLNRNYDIAWGTAGDSGNPENDTFRGTAAFSEPETQAIRDQLTKNKPVVYITYHSYSNCVMWPWDHKDEKPNDPNLATLGAQLGQKAGGYQAYQGCDMYLNSGDDVDWAFAKLGSLSYTVEVGSWNDGFMPPFNKMNEFWSKNKPLMLHAMKVADAPGQVHGPELKTDERANGALIAPGGATAVEAFVGQPGRPGTGTRVQANGKVSLPALEGAKKPVWVHAQGANGVWGPWSITWSK